MQILNHIFNLSIQEAASAAGTKAGAKAGYEEAMKAVARIALETAAKAAREKILAMASRREIKLSETWRPTSLIAVINMRKDLSDADKIRLAARAKMEGNLKDLLPDNFNSGATRKKKGDEDPLEGKLKFSSDGGKERCL